MENNKMHNDFEWESVDHENLGAEVDEYRPDSWFGMPISMGTEEFLNYIDTMISNVLFYGGLDRVSFELSSGVSDGQRYCDVRVYHHFKENNGHGLMDWLFRFPVYYWDGYGLFMAMLKRVEACCLDKYPED